MAEDFLGKIRDVIARFGMLDPGDRVIAAVSGGADSVALLYALRALGFDLMAAHLNHGLRGDESRGDADFVRELAARLGIRFITEEADVTALRKDWRVGIEEAARRARYDFLERISDDVGIRRIAVGHTADDQVETVLLNIIRGTGPDGVSGIPAIRGKIFRPLLGVSRSEVELYLKSIGVDWRTDSTNLDREYTRNRIRLDLIPYLERRFNPRIKDVVLSLASLIRDESALVRSESVRAFEDVSLKSDAASVRLDAGLFRELGRAVQRRCIRLAVERVRGDLLDIEFAQIEMVVDCTQKSEENVYTLPPGNVYVHCGRDEIRVFRKATSITLDFEYELIVPGTTEILDSGFAIEAVEVALHVRPTDLNQAVIDPAKIIGRLAVRPWKPGDRIIPLGMTGRRKLQDIFTDRKVPRGARGLVPIVHDDQKIVWVAGLVVSDLVKLTSDSREALRLTKKRTIEIE